MTTGGWIFLAVCWTLIASVTGWCFWLVLGRHKKPADDRSGGPQKPKG
ncbi:MAG: hypothetical protein ABIG11_08725 [bacterium]